MLFVYFFFLKGNLCDLKYQNMDKEFNFYNNVNKNKFRNCWNDRLWLMYHHCIVLYINHNWKNLSPHITFKKVFNTYFIQLYIDYRSFFLTHTMHITFIIGLFESINHNLTNSLVHPWTKILIYFSFQGVFGVYGWVITKIYHHVFDETEKLPKSVSIDYGEERLKTLSLEQSNPLTSTM